ncbi:MAG TPA: type II toxin-antitoxin system VapC family toxin [Verrucomicrobiae bacterium]|nr:type II toxin-antitoxin system VapC family toxin [Verrucomicrobiae bacterium]
MFLDTNFLIDLEEEIAANEVGPARRFLARHRNALIVVSVIALGELAAGMEDKESAWCFLAGFRIVTLKPEIAIESAAVDRELMVTGDRLGENDTWLAGFARYYGTPLVTNDAAFARVRGLRRLRY